MKLEYKHLLFYSANPVDYIEKGRRYSLININWQADFEFKGQLILRPFSDMTKEITVNGKTFIPIIELAKIAEVYQGQKIIKCENTEYDLVSGITEVSELHFLNKPTNHPDWHYQFVYTKNLNRFSLRNNTYEQPLSFINQLDLFQKMGEWDIDIFDFIKSGDAVNMNCL
jgi:hypothetical protein